MAKRYHQSKKDRRHESMGMKRYDERHSGGVNHNPDRFNDEFRHDKDSKEGGMFHHYVDMYAGMNDRRRMEMQDGNMLLEDPRAVANLPQNVQIKPYPKVGPYLPEGLDDTIDGVDAQIDYDDSQRRAHFYPKKV